jgi:hypothetical protein
MSKFIDIISKIDFFPKKLLFFPLIQLRLKMWPVDFIQEPQARSRLVEFIIFQFQFSEVGLLLHHLLEELFSLAGDIDDQQQDEDETQDEGIDRED